MIFNVVKKTKIRIIYIENMALFEVNKFKNNPKIKNNTING